MFIFFLTIMRQSIIRSTFDATRMRFTSGRRIFFQYTNSKIHFLDDVIPFDAIESLSLKDGYIFKNIVLRLASGEEKSISGYDIIVSFD